jgi:vacuolar-type H+-ATPase subunit I/STV1
MKKHTLAGKVIAWTGFFLFIFGVMFNEQIGVLAEDIPETLYPFSLPAIIAGIVIILISNFFKKVNG